jgi:DNA polymerase III delta prime subunit
MSQIDVARRAVLLNRRGTILFVSDNAHKRYAVEMDLIRSAVCTKLPLELRSPCSCPDCQSVPQHPKVQRIQYNDFDNQMVVVYSYPAKVVTIAEVDYLKLSQQMQLLIWLELYSSNHVILLTASRTSRLLPTILSRSFVYVDVPKIQVNAESREKAQALLSRLLKGELRIDDPIDPDDAQDLAQALQVILVEELERRQLSLERRLYVCGNSELQTLLKLVGRYLEAPKFHNLPLLLRSFQMLILQNIR